MIILIMTLTQTSSLQQEKTSFSEEYLKFKKQQQAARMFEVPFVQSNESSIDMVDISATDMVAQDLRNTRNRNILARSLGMVEMGTTQVTF